MPGLPRKSTVNQFKKLMKKSGKAKTNKASGAVDPTTRRIATYEQYFAMKENAHEDIDPYNEEDWNETNAIDRAKEIHNWLSIRLTALFAGKVEKEKDLGYELIISDEEIGIELLEIEDDELMENQGFYYGLFLNDKEEGWVNWRCLSMDRHKTPLASNYYINISGDEYKNRAFDDFKKVITSIIYHKNQPKKRNILGAGLRF